MENEKFVDLDEDIYILEAVSLNRLAYEDGILRAAAVEIDSRLAYSCISRTNNLCSRKDTVS